MTIQVNAKLSRSTECKSVPRRVCGPEACPVVRGDRICRNGACSEMNFTTKLCLCTTDKPCLQGDTSP